MLRRSSPILLLSILLLLAVAAPACGDDDPAPVDDNSAAPDGPPKGLRLLYSGARAGSVDMLLISDADEQVRIEGVSPGSASSYAALTPGMWRATLLEGGGNTPLNITVPSFNVEADDLLTLTIADDASGAPRAQLLDDALVAPGENMSRLRVVCLLNGPDIDLFDMEASMRWTEELTFGQLEPYREVQAGRRTFQVQLQTGQTLLEIPELPLRPTENSTLWLFGDADPNGDGSFDDAALTSLHTVEHSF